jgi:phosphoglycerate dehydrogenase-like enzyme
MHMTALLHGSWDESDVDYLKSLLHPEVTLIRDPPDRDYDILICGRPDEDILGRSKLLKHLIVPWAGLPASTAELMAGYTGISVHNIHHNAASAAEMALALMLAAARHIIPADRNLRLGDWSCRYLQETSVLISESRVLILGYGHIGRLVGRACTILGAEVSAIRRNIEKNTVSDGTVLYPLSSLHEILLKTDILVLALPLTPETKGIIGDRELDLLHNRSIVVNIGRGKLIDERSLFEHLQSGSIGSAGIDVWYRYPTSDESRISTPPSSFPFDSLDNIVMTPHMGGAFGTLKLEQLRMQHIADSLNTAAEGGELPCRINLELGY